MVKKGKKEMEKEWRSESSDKGASERKNGRRKRNRV